VRPSLRARPRLQGLGTTKSSACLGGGREKLMGDLVYGDGGVVVSEEALRVVQSVETRSSEVANSEWGALYVEKAIG
jgi:hypothetical protein